MLFYTMSPAHKQGSVSGDQPLMGSKDEECKKEDIELVKEEVEDDEELERNRLWLLEDNGLCDCTCFL